MRLRMPMYVALVAAIASHGCYFDRISTIRDFATVTTLVDSEPPLRDARTYAIPDTVIHSKQAVGAGLIGHDADDEIIARIRANFAAYGWREVTDLAAERPDVVVLTVAFEQTNVGVAYTSWWADWGYWPGWPAYGPEWGWGIPSDAVFFTYESGTLALVMLDIRNGNERDKKVPALWAAAINGILTQTSVDGALEGIDQAFAQSPYLSRP